jgi:hypothetical protein
MNRKSKVIVVAAAGVTALAAVVFFIWFNPWTSGNYLSVVPENASVVGVFSPKALLAKAGLNVVSGQKTDETVRQTLQDDNIFRCLLRFVIQKGENPGIDLSRKGLFFVLKDSNSYTMMVGLPLSRSKGIEDFISILRKKGFSSFGISGYKVLDDQAEWMVAYNHDVIWIANVQSNQPQENFKTKAKALFQRKDGSGYFVKYQNAIELLKGKEDIALLTDGAFISKLLSFDDSWMKFTDAVLKASGLWRTSINFNPGNVDLSVDFKPVSGTCAFQNVFKETSFLQKHYPFHHSKDLLLSSAISLQKSFLPELLKSFDISQLSAVFRMNDADVVLFDSAITGDMMLSISHADLKTGELLAAAMKEGTLSDNPFSMLDPDIRITLGTDPVALKQALTVLVKRKLIIPEGSCFRVSAKANWLPGPRKQFLFGVKDSLLIITNNNRLLPLNLTESGEKAPNGEFPDQPCNLFLNIEAERIYSLLANMTSDEEVIPLAGQFSNITIKFSGNKIHLSAHLKEGGENSLQLLMPYFVQP